MPVDDWQFWVVTALAVAGAWAVLRVALPRRRPKSGRTQITIDGKRAR